MSGAIKEQGPKTYAVMRDRVEARVAADAVAFPESGVRAMAPLDAFSGRYTFEMMITSAPLMLWPFWIICLTVCSATYLPMLSLMRRPARMTCGW